MACKVAAVSLEEYMAQFFRKYFSGGYGATVQSNAQAAAEALLAMLRRVTQRGGREDVRATFKALKQQLVWASTCESRERDIDAIFQLMAALVEAAEKLRQFSPCKERLSGLVLEEARRRLQRTVCRDAFAGDLDIRRRALDCIYTSMVQEVANREAAMIRRAKLQLQATAAAPVTPLQRLCSLALRAIPRSDIGSWSGVWQSMAALSGAQMLPLLQSVMASAHRPCSAQAGVYLGPVAEPGKDQGGPIHNIKSTAFGRAAWAAAAMGVPSGCGQRADAGPPRHRTSSGSCSRGSGCSSGSSTALATSCGRAAAAAASPAQAAGGAPAGWAGGSGGARAVPGEAGLAAAAAVAEAGQAAAAAAAEAAQAAGAAAAEASHAAAAAAAEASRAAAAAAAEASRAAAAAAAEASRAAAAAAAEASRAAAAAAAEASRAAATAAAAAAVSPVAAQASVRAVAAPEASHGGAAPLDEPAPGAAAVAAGVAGAAALAAPVAGVADEVAPAALVAVMVVAAEVPRPGAAPPTEPSGVAACMSGSMDTCQVEPSSTPCGAGAGPQAEEAGSGARASSSSTIRTVPQQAAAGVAPPVWLAAPRFGADASTIAAGCSTAEQHLQPPRSVGLRVAS